MFSRRSFCSLRRCRDSRLLAACSIFEIDRMDDLQAVRHIPQVLQQISLFTFGNADILHIIVKFKVIILPVLAVHFAEKLSAADPLVSGAESRSQSCSKAG